MDGRSCRRREPDCGPIYWGRRVPVGIVVPYAVFVEPHGRARDATISTTFRVVACAPAVHPIDGIVAGVRVEIPAARKADWIGLQEPSQLRGITSGMKVKKAGLGIGPISGKTICRGTPAGRRSELAVSVSLGSSRGARLRQSHGAAHNVVVVIHDRPGGGSDRRNHRPTGASYI